MWRQISWCLLVIVGCGRLPRFESSPHIYSLDGVKLISESIIGTQDSASFGQLEYHIGPKSRLLLRFESLDGHLADVDLGSGKKVRVDIAVSEEKQVAVAVSSLKLCGIEKNWMMLANWVVAHPFGSSGRWTKSGGDFDEKTCVLGISKSDDPRVIRFDMTQWFVDFPKGRARNYGLILISSETVTVLGERSPSYSPRILFDKF